MKTVLALLFALFFAMIFYKSSHGINVLLLDAAILVVLAFAKPDFYKSINLIKAVITIAWIMSAIFVMLYASTIAIFVHLIFSFAFCGYVTSAHWKQPLTAIKAGILSIISGIKGIGKLQIKTTTKKHFKLSGLGIYLIPSLIVLLFLILYANSSSTFANSLDKIGTYLKDIFSFFPNIFNIQYIVLFIIGLFIIAGFIFPNLKPLWLTNASEHEMDLIRNRKKAFYAFKNLDLKKEYSAQLFMFIALNILLFLLNLDDVKNVWLGFQFNGQFLKEYVHNGTYILILSIIISVILVLYAFRKNLNFYPSNTLKIVAILFVLQNVVLTFSVMLRNLHYVKYYNLAYLRIGLFYFLAMVVIVLVLLAIQVIYKKTGFYLLKTSTYAAMVLLLSLASIDWDVQICKYNFTHTEKGFLHRIWLVDRDEKCLPLMLANKEKLINGVPSTMHNYDEQDNIDFRLQAHLDNFKSEYPNRTIWEWNLADAKAYQQLTQ